MVSDVEVEDSLRTSASCLLGLTGSENGLRLSLPAGTFRREFVPLDADHTLRKLCLLLECRNCLLLGDDLLAQEGNSARVHVDEGLELAVSDAALCV